MGWFDVELVADGEAVRALTAGGKTVDPAALPKRPAEVSKAVPFKGAADPDPCYFGLFREDAVLLVAPADKFQIP